MKIELRPTPSFEDSLRVVQNLRDRDRDEIFATRWTDDPAAVARDVVATGDFRWGAYVDGRPVALIGAFPRWPRVWTMWAFGTDEWDKVVLALTRHARRFMMPAIFNSGAIRADCYALASHHDARRWLVYLGAAPEKFLDNYGKNGEKFVCYCWTREQAKRLLPRR